MDRKEKLLLADKLHKENKRDEALALLRELLAENEDDHFAWWGIANVSDDLTERLDAVNNVIELAPSFQKAHALRDELSALLPQIDPTTDDDISMLDIPDDMLASETLVVQDVDDDEYAEFQAAIADFKAAQAEAAADELPIDVAATFDDLDFGPADSDALSPAEQAGIEAMGFDAIINSINTGQADEDNMPEPELGFDMPELDDLDVIEEPQPDYFVDDDPTNNLPDLDNIAGEATQYQQTEDNAWMEAFAPSGSPNMARLDDPMAAWSGVLGVDDDPLPAYDPSVPSLDEMLGDDILGEGVDDAKLDELLDDVSVESAAVPDDTISYYGDGDIDRAKLAEAAASLNPSSIEPAPPADDLPSFDAMATDIDVPLPTYTPPVEEEAEPVAEPELVDAPTPNEEPTFDPMATTLDAYEPDPNDLPTALPIELPIVDEDSIPVLEDNATIPLSIPTPPVARPPDVDVHPAEDAIEFVLDADEQAELLDDMAFTPLPPPPPPVADDVTGFDFIAPSRPDISEDDLVIQMETPYEAPAFEPITSPQPESTSMDETVPHHGEVVHDNERQDLIVVPPPIHPKPPIAELLEKNRGLMRVAIGLVIARVVWRILAGGKRG